MKTKYDFMFEALGNIIAPYDIDLSKTDFFEETLLTIGGIEEKSKGCKFGPNRSTIGEYCNLDLAISPEAASDFIVNLNTISPELKAVDLTDMNPEIIKGHRARFIRINCQAIHQYLLPLIEKKLVSNPEIAVPYQTKTSFNDVASQLHQRFAKKGISITTTECIEETICYLVNQKSKRKIPLFNKFFEGPCKIFDATPVTTSEACIANITIKSRHFASNPQNQWSTDLYTTTPIELAQKIVAYFNSILPNSSKIAGEEQKTTKNKRLVTGIEPFTKITIDNKVLIKPAFLDAIDVALNEYSLDELDRYRVQSGTLSQKTSQTLTQLHQLAVCLEYSNNDYNDAAKALIGSINRLKTYFDNQSGVKPVPLDLIKDIHSKQSILKDLLTPEGALLENFQNKFDKPFQQLIQTAMKAINNQFEPLASPFITPQPVYGDEIQSYVPGMRC